MPFFNENIVTKILTVISEVSGGNLKNFEYEFQDGFETILILCDYAGEPNEDDLAKFDVEIKSSLDIWVPKFEGQPSWQINVYFKKTLIYCIVGEGSWGREQNC